MRGGGIKYAKLYSHNQTQLFRYAEPDGRLPYAWLFKTYTHRIEGVCASKVALSCLVPMNVPWSCFMQVDTDVMYLLSPNGSIVRSKARLKRDFRQLGVSEADLRFVSKTSNGERWLLTGSFWNLNLKTSTALMMWKHWRWISERDLCVKNQTYPQNPDDQWVYDPEVVPEGWLVKKYTFNSSHSKKVQNSWARNSSRTP